MLTTSSLQMHDLLVSLAIALPVFLVAVLFYCKLRQVARHLADKTGTALDNMLIEALEWPVFGGILLSGMYFAIVSLPFRESLDFEIRRGFHMAFILLATYAVAALLDAIFRWFKLEVVSKTETALDDWIVVILRILTPPMVGLLGLLICLRLFHIEAEGVWEWLGNDGWRIALIAIISTAALFILGFAGSKAIRAFVTRESPGQPEEEIEKRANTLTRVIITAGQAFIVFIAVFMILSQLGINITAVLAGASVVGIAIGFGAQNLMRDIIAGLFVIMENQYRVGDVVKIADRTGLVEEINLRRTVLRDMDGAVHIVPNGEIKVASNFTKEWSRVNLNISVAYGTDLDHAIAVINRVCQEMAEEPQWSPLILKTPQVLRVDNLGESGIELKIVGDTKPMRQWEVMGEIRKRMKEAFDRESIEIPWPHTKVFFGNKLFPSGSERGKKEEQ